MAGFPYKQWAKLMRREGGEAYICDYRPVIQVDAAGDIQSTFALALWERYCIIAKETTGVVESRVRECHDLRE